MILVNLHCSSGQVYKQAFLCRISFMCKEVGWLQTTFHGIMLQQTPGRTNFSSHTYTSSSCVKARKFFSELDTALPPTCQRPRRQLLRSGVRGSVTMVMVILAQAIPYLLRVSDSSTS